jgi:hypothetical protein
MRDSMSRGQVVSTRLKRLLEDCVFGKSQKLARNLRLEVGSK